MSKGGTPGGIGSLAGKGMGRGLSAAAAKEAREKILIERFKEKIKKLREKPKTPLGRMKKPKPGSYDYQLQETMKPKYKGMAKGGQSKFAKNKSTIDPRIDKKDPLADLKASERRKKKLKEQGSFMMGGKVMKTPGRMLSGGQIKIAKKAPPFNKIDAKDFAVLRAEKAKNRGKGFTR